MATKRYGDEISWSLGPCSGKGGYRDNQYYHEKCEITPGKHQLSCKDAFGDGWNGGYIVIDGQKFCEDFKCSLSDSNCRTEKHRIIDVPIKRMSTYQH